MDAVAVYEAATEAVARARAGDGPSFIEAKTYRFYNHHGVQVLGVKYRSDEELERWKKRDPIDMLEARLVELGVMTAEEIEAVHADVEAQIEAAIEFADESPLPDGATLLDDVYTVTTTPAESGVGSAS
jgi:pyruvate dehydrogenase E1 component alpha subunit